MTGKRRIMRRRPGGAMRCGSPHLAPERCFHGQTITKLFTLLAAIGLASAASAATDVNGDTPYTWFTFDTLTEGSVSTATSVPNNGTCTTAMSISDGSIVANDGDGNAWTIASSSVQTETAKSDSVNPSTYIVRINFNEQTYDNKVIWSCNGKGYNGPCLVVNGNASSGYTLYVCKHWGGKSDVTGYTYAVPADKKLGYHWYALTTAQQAVTGSKFYVDGVYVGTTSGSGNWYSGQNSFFCFGKYGNGGDAVPTGLLYDDMRMYNQVLTAEKIKNIAGTVKFYGAKWGNMGYAPSTPGVLTGSGTFGNGNYGSFNVKFGTVDNISPKEIEGQGTVKLSKITFVRRDSGTAQPSKVKVTQDDKEVIGTVAFNQVDRVLYGDQYPGNSGHKWTQESASFGEYVATFTSDVQFDTSKQLKLEFLDANDEAFNAGLRMIQPANSVCQSQSDKYSPAIEIIGDYTPTIIDYVAQVTGAKATWSTKDGLDKTSGADWQSSMFNSITLTNTQADATLTIDEPIAAGTFKVVSASGKKLTIKGFDQISARVIDFSEAAGKIDFGVDGTELAENAVVGAPYSYWFYSGAITGTGNIELPTVPEGYSCAIDYVSGYGTRFVVSTDTEKFGSININFVGNKSKSTTDSNAKVGSLTTDVGGHPVVGTSWNDLEGKNQTNTSVSKYIKTDGTVVTDAGITLTASQVANSYGSGAADNMLITGYIDDGSHPIVQIANIPFAKYRVILYRATDTGSTTFSAAQIGTTSSDTKIYYGPTSSDATGGNTLVGSTTTVWGKSDYRTSYIEGVNYIVSDVLEGTAGEATAYIYSYKHSGRACVAAIQIVEVGISKEYTATMKADANFSDLVWSPAKPAGGFPAGTTFTVVNEASAATLTMDAPLTADGLTIQSAAEKVLTIKMKTTSDFADVTTFDASTALGGVKFDVSDISSAIQTAGGFTLPVTTGDGVRIGATGFPAGYRTINTGSAFAIAKALHMPYRLGFSSLNGQQLAFVNESTDSAKGSIEPSSWKGSYNNYDASDYKTAPYSHRPHDGAAAIIADESQGQTLGTAANGYCFAFWVNDMSVTAWTDIFGFRIGGQNYGFECKGGNAYTIYDGGGSNCLSKEITITKNAWHHIAVLFPAGGTVATVYIDGVSAATFTPTTSDTFDLYQVLCGGRRNGSAADAVAGTKKCGNNTCDIDEVVVYDGQVTADEIAAMAAQSVASVPVSYTAEVTEDAAFADLDWRYASGDKTFAPRSDDPAVRIALTGEGTVTLSDAFGGWVDLDEGVVLSPTSVAGMSKIAGAGTIVYPTTALPGAEKSNYTNSTWTGIVWLNYTTKHEFKFSEYGNANSKLKLTGVNGYSPNNNNEGDAGFSGTIILADSGNTKAWTINDAYVSKYYVAKLEGDGSFVTGGNQYSKAQYRFKDVDNFNGTIDASGNAYKCVVIGTDTSIEPANGQILIASGATAHIASGKTWKANAAGDFKILGTLTVDAEATLYSSSTENNKVIGSGVLIHNGRGATSFLPKVQCAGLSDASGWTGTVWYKNFGADSLSIALADCGNASSKIKLTGVRGYLPTNEVKAEVILEDDGETAALTLKNGSSNSATTLAKVSGSGTILNDTGCGVAQCYKITDGTAFSGSITMVQTSGDSGKRIVFGSTTSSTKATITVDAKNSATVGSGKTWTATNGIFINGTISGSGTLASATTFGEGAEIDTRNGLLTATGDLTFGATTTVRATTIPHGEESVKILNKEGTTADAISTTVTVYEGASETAAGGVFTLEYKTDGVYLTADNLRTCTASGNWDDASTWGGKSAPVAGQTVCIDASAGDIVLTLSKVTSLLYSLSVTGSHTVSFVGDYDVTAETYTIGEGATLTLKNGLKASQLTNNGTIRFEGGTEENPIEITGDADFGIVTLAADTYVKNTANDNRKHQVTGEGAGTSFYEIAKPNDGVGTSTGTQFHNLTLVSGITTANKKLWLAQANSLDATVNLLAKGAFYFNGYSATFGSLSGAGDVAASATSVVLTITCNAAADYSGTSSVAFTIAGAAVQTLSGAYTGALTVNGGAHVALGASAKPSPIVNNSGTVEFLSGYTYDFGATSRALPEGYVLDEGVVVTATQTKDEFNNGSVEITGLPSSIATIKLTRADREVIEVPVSEGTATYTDTTVKISGPATWFDYTFTKADLTRRQSENNNYILNCGTAGESASLKYDTNYSAANSYNADNGALLAKSTPWRDMSGTTAWPEEYTVAVYGNVPDVDMGCLVGFGSSSSGKKFLAIVRGSTANEIMLVEGTDMNTRVKTNAVMAAENATSAKHLVVFTKDTNYFRIYCDGTLINTTAAATLGNGFQIGSVHGGVAPNADCKGKDYTGITRISEIEDQTKKDAVEISMIRIFKKVITYAEMTTLAEKFPYTSKGGLYKRTINSADETLRQTDAWADSDTEEKTALPQTKTIEEVTYRPSVNITLGVSASTLTINEAAVFDKMTFGGSGTLTIKKGTDTPAEMSGALVVNTPIVVEYGSLNITKSPTTLGANGSITFDLTGYTISRVTTRTRVLQLTGQIDESDSKVTIKDGTAPTTTGSVSSIGYADGQYWLFVEPDREAGTVYLIAGTTELTDNTLVKTSNNADTYLLPGDTVAVTADATLALNQTVALKGFDIQSGTLEFSTVKTDAYAIKVGSGATFDLNGKSGTAYAITLEGGSLVNTGDSLGDVTTFTTLTLTADSKLGGTSNFTMQKAGYAATMINLGGYTLTKEGNNLFSIVSTTVNDSGTIYVEEGTFYSSESTTFADKTASIKVGQNGEYQQRESSGGVTRKTTVANIIGEGGTLNIAGVITGFELTGNITLAGSGTYGTITNAADAVANIGTRRNLTFEGAGSVKAQLTEAYNPGDTVAIFKVADSTTTDVAELRDISGNVIDPTYYTVKDGTVTFKKEAKVGTVYYFTLNQALDGAAGNSTVTLLTNVTMTAAYELAKSITLDGDVYELDGLGFSGSGKLTVASGYIGVDAIPESRSLIGGRYSAAKKEAWMPETGYHYVEIASTESDKYYQIVKGETPTEDQKAYPVVINNESVGTVALNETQLEKIGCTTESTPAQVATALATTQSNDLTKYQNLVLGLDGEETEYKDIPVVAPVQSTSTDTIAFKLGSNVKVDTTTGAKVTYKVYGSTDKSDWTAVSEETAHDGTALVKLPTSGVKYYKFDVVVTPAK